MAIVEEILAREKVCLQRVEAANALALQQPLKVAGAHGESRRAGEGGSALALEERRGRPARPDLADVVDAELVPILAPLPDDVGLGMGRTG